jgi:hypothetical protein
MNATNLARLIAILAPALAAAAAEPTWVKHEINAKSIFEGAGAFDVDGDGKIDVVSGDTWYQAPTWKPHRIRDVSKVGTYMNCFSTLPMDVDGDGDTDFISVSYFGKNVGWVENPGKTGESWTYHEIDLPGPSECAVLVDLDADGKPDILPNTVNTVVWYSLEKAAAKPDFRKHDHSAAKGSNGHGVGTGDINGDGRLDLLTPNGWFEAPADPKNQPWTWHPDWNLGATGIQILARDVDSDGLVDLVHGMGHDIGLYWSRQTKTPDGKTAWNRELIDNGVASVHTLLWVDFDGDGKKEEILTGKRVYAHEKEADDVKAPIIAWYSYDRANKKWDRHMIYQGQDAANAPTDPSKRNAQIDFAPGTAGTGLEMTVVDLDGDGDQDLLCPGKSGLYWFERR